MYWNRLSSPELTLSKDDDGDEYNRLCAYLNTQFGYRSKSDSAEDQPNASAPESNEVEPYQIEGAINKISRKELTFYQGPKPETGYPILYRVGIHLQKIDQAATNASVPEETGARSETGAAKIAPLSSESKAEVLDGGTRNTTDSNDSQPHTSQASSNKNLTNFEWTNVYVVRDPLAQSSGDSDTREWYLLDGEGTVLRELNAKFDGIKINEAASVDEYLDFFCSFLCAEKGSFALIEKAGDLDKLDDSDRFERALFEKRHRAVRNEVRSFPDELTFKKVKEEIKKCIRNENPSYPIRAESIKKTPSDTISKVRLTRLVLYNRRIFYSTFEVLKSGYVEMLEDRQIFPSLVVGSSLNKSNENEAKITPVNFDLAVRRYATFRHRKSGLVLFTKSAERKFISASEFMAYAKSAGSISYLSNLLIEGEVTFGAGENVTGVECSNLQFLDGILFDHCIVSSAFRFEHCQFLGTFGAPGTRFHSQVAVKHSEIFAVTDIFQSAKDEAIAPYTALDLDSVSIDSGLSLECLTVHASVSCRHLTVRSDANLSGMRVLPLVEENWWRANKQPAFWAAPLSDSVLFDLQRSSFAGSLNLGIWVDRVQARKSSGRRVTVCGVCRFDTMSIGKSLILEGLAVVRSSSEKVSVYPCSPSLGMPGVTVEGNIQSWNYDTWDPTGRAISPPLLVDGAIDLKWSTIAGYVDLRTSHIGKELDCRVMRAAWLTLEPSRVDAISADNMEIEEAEKIDWVNYSLSAAHQPKVVGNAPADWIEQFSRRMSIVQGNLELGNAIIPGGVTLTGTTVNGTVDVRLGGQLGQIKALPAFGIYTEFENKNGQEIPVKRKIVKRQASLGRLRVRNSTIAGPVNLWGTKIGREGSQGQNVASEPAIDISTSSIKGGLYLHAQSSWEGQDVLCKLLNPYDQEGPKYDWVDHLGKDMKNQSIREMALSYFWQTVPDVFQATVIGDVDVLATDIGADLDLSNTRVCGRIRLNDSHVRCDVRAVTCLQELDPKATAIPELRAELQTQCYRFEFQSLRCDGDLMLAGLDVAGNVDGRNAIVRGHGEFNCDWIVEDPTLLKSTKQKDDIGRASIGGDLELCGCEVGLLRLDGRSFDTPTNKINLARVTVSTLEISGALPKKINLQSIKVSNWEITKSNDEKKGERLVKLLQATKDNYDSGPYQSIEASLASEGKDEDADHIHRAKNWRELAEKFGYEKESLSFNAHPVLRSIAPLLMVSAIGPLIIPRGSCAHAAILFIIGLMFYFGPFVKLAIWDGLILGAIMGFGTRLVPAFIVWATLSFGLALVLSNPCNVQPTFASVNTGIGKIKINSDNVSEVGSKIQEIRKDLQKQVPQDPEWGFWNHSLWLALDITVPLVPFNLHDEWEPRESKEATVFPCCSDGKMPIAPKTLANILAPLSWAIWTLIATGMAGVIRTRN